jgi:glycosyltransferase involved in cell wall biosynthesis
MLISVIIPAYNVKSYLKNCYDSVTGQSYSSIEVILVDNNSTDGTAEIINNIVAENPSIIALQEPQQGASYARNAGLLAARGEWIQFLDADDILEPGKIQHQVDMIKTSITVPDIIIGGYKKIFASIITYIDSQKAISIEGVDFQLNYLRKISYDGYASGLNANIYLIIYSDNIENKKLVHDTFYNIILNF